MTSKAFDEIVEAQIEHIKSSMVVKGQEYRRDSNPFHNFESGAKMSNQSREKVLFGFLLKHLVSVQDMRNDLEKGIAPQEYQVKEKYGDIINYLILEKAMMLEHSIKTEF